jgi:hemerythrin-like domain-containing protein
MEENRHDRRNRNLMSKMQNTAGPVASEHQESLLLARHLQQGEKILAKTLSYDPVDQAQEIVAFYNLHLAEHFEIEERILFPLVSRYIPTAADLIKELTEEHRRLEQIIDVFKQEVFKDIELKLRSFGALLESHILKEDQQLFPLFERHAPAAAVREVEKQIEKFYEERRKPAKES